MMLIVDWSCPTPPFGVMTNISDREKGKPTAALFSCWAEPTVEKVPEKSCVLFTHVVSWTVQPLVKWFCQRAQEITRHSS